MKFKFEELISKAREAIKKCLSEIPFWDVCKISEEFSHIDSGKADLMVLVKSLDNNKIRLICEVKNSGQPRYAHEAVNNLLRCDTDKPNTYRVFIAPYISDKSADICLRDKIGYIDFSGNCYLSYQNVFIRKEGHSNAYTEKRELRSLYSPKSERILRILLCNSGREWKTQALSKEAGVSIGQVHNVKKQLEDREWVCSGKNGFILRNANELLNEWSENYKPERNTKKEYYTILKTAEIESQLGAYLGKIGAKYAFTEFTAAARLSPHVRYQKVTIFIKDADRDNIENEFKLKKVPSGSNLNILSPYDEGVFYGSKTADDGLTIASPIQVYLDLINNRGRGEEAAEKIVEEVLKNGYL